MVKKKLRLRWVWV